MSEDLMFQSAGELAASVREGDVSARELVEASLQAIERLNGELNAFVTLCDERALAEADAIQAGDSRPLAGVPIAIKDLVALTEGVRTTMGMNAMEEWVPSVDSALVRRLREAGAIVVGKTNTPEMGILPVTEPQRFGPARNPWDTSRTTGRLLGRERRGGGVRHGPGRPRERRRRLDPHPRIVLRAGRPQAQPRAGVAGARVQRVRGRRRDRGLRQPRRRRHRADPRRDRGLRARRPLLGARSVRAVRRGGRSATRARCASPTRPPLPTACPCTRTAPRQWSRRRSCSSRSATRVEEAPAFTDELYVENFIKIWTAGVADEVHTYGRLRGQPLDLDKLEPLTREMVDARGLVEGRRLPRRARLPAPHVPRRSSPPGATSTSCSPPPSRSRRCRSARSRRRRASRRSSGC